MQGSRVRFAGKGGGFFIVKEAEREVEWGSSGGGASGWS